MLLAVVAMLTCSIAVAMPVAADQPDDRPLEAVDILAVRSGQPTEVLFAAPPALLGETLTADDVIVEVDGEVRTVRLRQLDPSAIEIVVVVDTTMSSEQIRSIQAAVVELALDMPSGATMRIVGADGRVGEPAPVPGPAIAELRRLSSTTTGDLQSAVDAASRVLRQRDPDRSALLIVGGDLSGSVGPLDRLPLSAIAYLVDVGGSGDAATLLGPEVAGASTGVADAGGVLAAVDDLSEDLRNLYAAQVTVPADTASLTVSIPSVGDAASRTVALDADTVRPDQGDGSDATAEQPARPGDEPGAVSSINLAAVALAVVVGLLLVVAWLLRRQIRQRSRARRALRAVAAQAPPAAPMVNDVLWDLHVAPETNDGQFDEQQFAEERDEVRLDSQLNDWSEDPLEDRAGDSTADTSDGVGPMSARTDVVTDEPSDSRRDLSVADVDGSPVDETDISDAELIGHHGITPGDAAEPEDDAELLAGVVAGVVAGDDTGDRDADRDTDLEADPDPDDADREDAAHRAPADREDAAHRVLADGEDAAPAAPPRRFVRRRRGANRPRLRAVPPTPEPADTPAPTPDADVPDPTPIAVPMASSQRSAQRPIAKLQPDTRAALTRAHLALRQLALASRATASRIPDRLFRLAEVRANLALADLDVPLDTLIDVDEKSREDGLALARRVDAALEAGWEQGGRGDTSYSTIATTLADERSSGALATPPLPHVRALNPVVQITLQHLALGARSDQRGQIVARAVVATDISQTARLARPVLMLSTAFVAAPDRYRAALAADLRDEGERDAAIRYVCASIAHGATLSAERLAQLDRLRVQYRDRATDVRILPLVDVALEQPIITADVVRRRLDVSMAAARELLATGAEAGWLERVSRLDGVWVAHQVRGLFTDDEPFEADSRSLPA